MSETLDDPWSGVLVCYRFPTRRMVSAWVSQVSICLMRVAFFPYRSHNYPNNAVVDASGKTKWRELVALSTVVSSPGNTSCCL